MDTVGKTAVMDPNMQRNVRIGCANLPVANQVPLKSCLLLLGLLGWYDAVLDKKLVELPRLVHCSDMGLACNVANTE